MMEGQLNVRSGRAGIDHVGGIARLATQQLCVLLLNFGETHNVNRITRLDNLASLELPDCVSGREAGSISQDS